MGTATEKDQINGDLPKNLWNILEDICNTECGNKGITFIESEDEGKRVVKRLTYNELRKDAQKKSFMLKSDDIKRKHLGSGGLNRAVVLDLDSHFEKITWFWGVVAAGWIPV